MRILRAVKAWLAAVKEKLAVELSYREFPTVDDWYRHWKGDESRTEEEA